MRRHFLQAQVSSGCAHQPGAGRSGGAAVDSPRKVQQKSQLVRADVSFEHALLRFGGACGFPPGG
jgi:hypothetical protein